MDNIIKGLHHITAIAGNPQLNYDFYAKVLGLRLVKKTVNFDDPQTYHFYFGDSVGTPGTILTFFPWPGVKPGKTGAGMATEIGFEVPENSLDFWENRFEEYAVSHGDVMEKFGEKTLAFRDPEGLNLTLVGTNEGVEGNPWETSEIKADAAIKGFHSVTLTVRDKKGTVSILNGIFGYELIKQEGNVFRYKTEAVESASIVDIVEDAAAQPGLNAGGTNHHVAFRVKDEATLMAFREIILKRGHHITEKIDRQYFYSLYFREPGGVLFEIATDNPGFATDETPEGLGSSLQLPPQYESARASIEKVLLPLEM